MAACSGLEKSDLVNDRSGSLTFKVDEPNVIKHTVYVDNLGVISPDSEAVVEIMKEMGTEFGDRKFESTPKQHP